MSKHKSVKYIYKSAICRSCQQESIFQSMIKFYFEICTILHYNSVSGILYFIGNILNFKVSGSVLFAKGG